MQTKEIIALLYLTVVIFGGTIAGVCSRRVRDLLFIGILVLIPMTEFYDVNFVSRDWYRGTVRGFEFSLVDSLAISLLLSSIIGRGAHRPRIFWPASLGLILLYFAYGIMSVAISEPKLWGMFELSKMVRGIVLFLAVAHHVRSERELRIFLLFLALVVAGEGLLCLRQRYLWGVHRVFAHFPDPNSLSMFFCMTTPLLIAAFNSRLPTLHKVIFAGAIALACVGEILTISRAGVVTLALVMFGAAVATMGYTFSFKKVAIASVVLLGVTAVTVKSWETLASRFQESTLDREYGNSRSQGRGYYIRLARAIAAEQWLGVGLNNWSYWVSNKYGPLLGYKFVPYKGTDWVPSEIIPPGSNVDAAQAAPAHNLAALTVGELGIPGLAILGLLFLRWYQMAASFLWPRSADPMRRVGVGIFFALCGLFLQSLTEWVFRLSHIYYLTHLFIGVLAALYLVRRAERREVECEEDMLIEESLPEGVPARG